MEELFKKQVFKMSEMRQIFDVLSQNSKFQNIIMSGGKKNIERCALVSTRQSPTFEVSSPATLDLKFKN